MKQLQSKTYKILKIISGLETNLANAFLESLDKLKEQNIKLELLNDRNSSF